MGERAMKHIEGTINVQESAFINELIASIKSDPHLKMGARLNGSFLSRMEEIYGKTIMRKHISTMPTWLRIFHAAYKNDVMWVRTEIKNQFY